MSENIKTKETNSHNVESVLEKLGSVDLNDAKKKFMLETGVSFAKICISISNELGNGLNELRTELDKSYENEIASLEKRKASLDQLMKSSDINDDLKNEIWKESVYIAHRMDSLYDESRKTKNKIAVGKTAIKTTGFVAAIGMICLTVYKCCKN